MKRSRYIALCSMGVSALALAACEDPNTPVAAKAYESVAACVEDGRSETDCTSAFVAAENAYETAYPKYESEADCEVNAGPENCELDRPSSRSASWRPSMTGFLIGAALGSRVQPQPLVPSTASASGRATTTGVPVGGSVNTMIPTHAAKAPSASQVTTAHTQMRGGFGGTASHVSAAHASGGSSAHSSGG